MSLTANDESRAGMRHLPGNEQERKSSFAAVLKLQFRELVKAILPKVSALPEPRRKRGTEDTGRAFKMTARIIVRRAVRLPAEAYAKAGDYLSRTLDWLNQWQHEESLEDEAQPTPQDYLYPHL